MLSIIAPFGIDHIILDISSAFPKEIQTIIFSLLLLSYMWFAAKVLINMLCRIDFIAASAIRGSGHTPPTLQYWIGDFFEKIPNRIALTGFLFVLLATTYSIIEYGAKPRHSEWLFTVKTLLSKCIDFIMA